MLLLAAIDDAGEAHALVRVLMILACVSVLEALWPAGERPSSAGRARNLAFYAINTVLMLHLPLIAAWMFPRLPNVALLPRVLPDGLGAGVFGAIAMTACYALVWDFFQYWFHRWAHRSRVLWSLHVLHHRDPAMNATTSLRRSVGDVLAGFYLVQVPTYFVCGGGMLPYYGSLVLFSGWGYLNHANVRLRLGSLTAWLSGPHAHRLHHGREREYHHCNFAAFFMFYDRVFGTYRYPAPTEWPVTGVEEQRSSRPLVAEALVPQLRLSRRWRVARESQTVQPVRMLTGASPPNTG